MGNGTLVWLDDPQNCSGQSGFSGAGLPHQTQNLAVVNVEGHVVEDLLIGSLAERAALMVAAADMGDGEHQFLVHMVSSFRLRVGMAAMSRWV